MLVHVNRSPISGPWGGGARLINALHELAPSMGVTLVSTEEMQRIIPDVILIVGFDGDSSHLSAQQLVAYRHSVAHLKDVRLVVRVNENDARKGTWCVDRSLIELSSHVTGTIFVSNWLQGYFNDKGWRCREQAVVVNGVDPNVFAPAPKLGNGRVNVVTHHWSDNYLKGFDVYDELDALAGREPEKFTFTYVGRDRGSFKHSRTVPPLQGRALGAELGRYDVYVSASRFDPGPNHVLEALACGLPTYVHVDGGGAVEFAGAAAAYASWDELLTRLLACERPVNSYQLQSWHSCIQRCITFLSEHAGTTTNAAIR